MPVEAFSDNQPDPDAVLWRYMDTPRFLSMLTSNALWFTRADQFDDQYEGARLPADRSEKHPDLSSIRPELIPVQQGLADVGAILRRQHFMTCWHQNPEESAAMWRAYARRGDAVAVTTTPARLEQALQTAAPTIHGGLVEYKSPHMWDLPSPWVRRFFRKRTSFNYETEYRLVFSRNLYADQSDTDLNVSSSALGTPLPVSMQDVIASVHVGPREPAWFYESINALVQKYLDLAAKKSTFDSLV